MATNKAAPLAQAASKPIAPRYAVALEGFKPLPNQNIIYVVGEQYASWILDAEFARVVLREVTVVDLRKGPKSKTLNFRVCADIEGRIDTYGFINNVDHGLVDRTSAIVKDEACAAALKALQALAEGTVQRCITSEDRKSHMEMLKAGK